MCGRYSLFAPPDRLADQFDLTDVSAHEPRYNAAPSQSLPVVTDDHPDALQSLEWGLIPPWAGSRDEGGHINARAETIDRKASFADAFRQRTDGSLDVGRCLVPADGFYEWTDTGEGTQPYRVTQTDGGPFAMAGLRAQWRPETTQAGLDAFTGSAGGESGGGPGAGDDAVVETFAIVTTEPNAVVEELHHRMAVILPEGREREWLREPAESARDLLAPCPADRLRAYPVSTAVNDPANDSPALVEDVS